MFWIICFRMFCSKQSITFEMRTYQVVDFTVLTYFKSNLDSVKPSQLTNSVTRILLNETLYKFSTIKCLCTLYLHMYMF